MPTIFLSPSTQENEYITGGNEEYYMNLIVDAMVPYLKANNLDFERSNPGESIDEILEHVNEQGRDLYLALRSGYSPEGTDPPLQGSNIYHYIYTPIGGERAAYYIAANLMEIYPRPDLVKIIPIDTHEIRDTNAPSVIVELGYLGNPKDEIWMKQNIDAIAKNLVLSITQFLNQPFMDV